MIEQILTELHSKAIIVLALWIIPLIAYFVDFWTGVEGAKAQGERIHSSGLRKTFNKVGEYWRFQLMALLIDLVGSLLPFYELPYVSMIATISIVLVEFRSVRENFKKKKSGIIDAMNISENILQQVIKASDSKAAKAVIENLLKQNKNEKN